MKYIFLLLLVSTQAWAQIAPPFTWSVRDYDPSVTNTITISTTTGTNDTLQKTSGTSSSSEWTSAAIASENIVSGDGYLEATIGQGGTVRYMMGFTSGDLPASTTSTLTDVTFYNTINGGIFYFNGQISFINSTNSTSTIGPASVGDVIRLEFSGSDIVLKQNGSTICTFGQSPCTNTKTTTPSYPIKPIFAAKQTNAKFESFVLSSSSSGPVCGADDGGTFVNEPTNLCDSGGASAVTNNGATWDWTCTIGGTSVACSANRITLAAPPFTWTEYEYNGESGVMLVTSTSGTNDTREKIGGVNGNSENAALSVEQINSGDLFLEFTVPVSPTSRQEIGITSQTPPANGSTGISFFSLVPIYDFGITLVNGEINWINNSTIGVISGTTPAAGDTYRIEVVSGDVILKRKPSGGTVFTVVCTFGQGACSGATDTAITYPIRVMQSARFIGAKVENISFGNTNPPLPAGTFNQFTPSSPPVPSVNVKGGLLTSEGDGIQIEFQGCADGEVIVYNSSTATGLDCAAN